jgi:hypothetical protein
MNNNLSQKDKIILEAFSKYNGIYVFYILSMLTILLSNLPFYEWWQLLSKLDIYFTGTLWSPLDDFQDGLIYTTITLWNKFNTLSKINIIGVFFHVFSTLVAFFIFSIYFD